MAPELTWRRLIVAFAVLAAILLTAGRTRADEECPVTSNAAIIYDAGTYKCADRSGHLECVIVPTETCADPIEDYCNRYPTEWGRKRCKSWRNPK